jgi:hypothetical protein
MHSFSHRLRHTIEIPRIALTVSDVFTYSRSTRRSSHRKKGVNTQVGAAVHICASVHYFGGRNVNQHKWGRPERSGVLYVAVGEDTKRTVLSPMARKLRDDTPDKVDLHWNTHMYEAVVCQAISSICIWISTSVWLYHCIHQPQQSPMFCCSDRRCNISPFGLWNSAVCWNGNYFRGVAIGLEAVGTLDLADDPLRKH